MIEPKNRLEEGDDIGVGMNADGTLNVIPPDQVESRMIERDAYEAEEDEPEDDLSDLDELDEVFGD